jgi:hypothetical protein
MALYCQATTGKKGVIQVKRYKEQTGPAVVREIFGLMVAHHKDFAAVIGLSGFSKGAYTFNFDKPVTLLETKRLLVLSQANGVTPSFFRL